MISSIMPLAFHEPLAPVIARSQGSDHSAEYWTEEEHRGKPVTEQELQVGRRAAGMSWRSTMNFDSLHNALHAF